MRFILSFWLFARSSSFSDSITAHSNDDDDDNNNNNNNNTTTIQHM